jgi:hypothetical protein
VASVCFLHAATCAGILAQCTDRLRAFQLLRALLRTLTAERVRSTLPLILRAVAAC